MTDLILKLPETLHQKLIDLAKQENLSLDQYILNTLNNEINHSYQIKRLSEADIKNQTKSFQNLIQELGENEDQEIETILNQREIVINEDDLTSEIKNKLVGKIKQMKSL
jgi:hypothetical protein